MLLGSRSQMLRERPSRGVILRDEHPLTMIQRYLEGFSCGLHDPRLSPAS